ncbi:MAG TPA: hypothetical protein ENK15_01575 [Thermopetrobacter sp.]|nr:hypothetical protein [Thermopetrobacter sp.]
MPPQMTLETPVGKRIINITAGVAGVVVLIGALAVVALYWRLSSGPVELGWLQPRLEAAINGALRRSGLRVVTSGIILRLGGETRLPTLRLRNVRFLDAAGQVVFNAPLAAVGIDGAGLLRGAVRVRRILLIGPSIRIRRDPGGRFHIGFFAGSGRAAKQEKGRPPPFGKLGGERLWAFIDRNLLAARPGAGFFADIEMLRIRRGRVYLADAMTGIDWRIPDAAITFRRMPWGHALFATGAVHSRGQPWPLELSARFRRATRRVEIDGRIEDVLLSDFTRRVFGITRLARLTVPINAKLALRIAHDGMIEQAAAELSAGSGRIAFPRYMARPLNFDEGLIRLSWEPRDRRLRIHRSSVVINGRMYEMTGHARLEEVAGSAAGPLPPVRLSFDLVQSATGGAARGAIERFHLTARLDAARRRIDVEDMRLRAGAADVRVSGAVREGSDGLALRARGALKNISAQLVRDLWPPKLAPCARDWMTRKVRRAVIDSGDFQVDLPATAIRAALKRERPLPRDKAVLRLRMGEVALKYVKTLPVLRIAAGGVIEVNGGQMRFTARRARTTLPSGATITMRDGVFTLGRLIRKVKPATLGFSTAGDIRHMSEFLDLPPMRVFRRADFDRERLAGQVSGRVRLRYLTECRKKARDLRIAAEGRVRDGVLTGLPGGQKVDGAQLDMRVGGGKLRLTGRARVGGVDSRLDYARPLKPRQPGRLVLRTVLDQRILRQRYGLDVSSWLQGPLPVTLRMKLTKGEKGEARVAVDMSRAALRIPVLDQVYPPRKGTTATARLLVREKELEVRDFVLKGRGIRVAGHAIFAQPGVLRSATLTRFSMNGATRLALGVTVHPKRLDMAAAGQRFDARPLIRQFFKRRRNGGRKVTGIFGRPATVRVNIERVLAMNDVVIRDVRGTIDMKGGAVTGMRLTGRMPSGSDVGLLMRPARGELRRLRIVSGDGGSMLRAANLYGRVHGGRMDFSALLAPDGVRRGLLVMEDFQVRGENRLRLSGRRQAATGPRRVAAQPFSRLVLPFSTDPEFIRIGDALVHGNGLGITANGLIRRRDGALDVGGTIIPAYELNAALGQVPLIGQLLSGGGGNGIVGFAFVLSGSMRRPNITINPVSALAPGVFSKLFSGGQRVNPDGTPIGSRRKKPGAKARTNFSGGR